MVSGYLSVWAVAGSTRLFATSDMHWHLSTGQCTGTVGTNSSVDLQESAMVAVVAASSYCWSMKPRGGKLPPYSSLLPGFAMSLVWNIFWLAAETCDYATRTGDRVLGTSDRVMGTNN
jgi:hypothetical protein